MTSRNHSAPAACLMMCAIALVMGCRMRQELGESRTAGAVPCIAVPLKQIAGTALSLVQNRAAEQVGKLGASAADTALLRSALRRSAHVRHLVLLGCEYQLQHRDDRIFQALSVAAARFCDASAMASAASASSSRDQLTTGM